MPAVTDLLARHASDQADRIALSDGTHELTYGELWQRSRALGGRFREEGVGPGDHVVIGAAKSVDTVAATIATWLIGAVHVPIDPAQPEARQRAILERVRPRLVIGDLPGADERRWSAEELNRPLPAAACFEPEPPAGERIAYCMFTSGSTGLPKGVQISHRAVTRRYVCIVQATGSLAPQPDHWCGRPDRLPCNRPTGAVDRHAGAVT